MDTKENTKVIFDLSQLENKRLVGKGATANVYCGVYNGVKVAAKVFRGGSSTRAAEEANRERETLSKCEHSNVVRLLGTATTKDNEYVNVLEYYDEGNLDVRKLGGYNKNPCLILRIAIDVAEGLAHAHSKNVLHRDVKPSQVLLSSSGKAVISDFGLSCGLKSAECSIEKCGTCEFMAPEVYNATNETKYGEPADVYSFGVLLWCLVAAEKYPYTDYYVTAEHAAKKAALNELRPKKLKRLKPGQEIMELIESCWAHDPDSRPKMVEIIEKLNYISKYVESCDYKSRKSKKFWFRK